MIPLSERRHNITVGYNRRGQSFFDIIQKYNQYIHSYFFSFTKGLYGVDFDEKEVYDELRACNTYGIPANLLLNEKRSYHHAHKYIEMAKEICDLKSITILEPGLALLVSDTNPDLEVHLSVNFFDHMQCEDNIVDNYRLLNEYYKVITECVDVVNISSVTSHGDKVIIDFLKHHGIKSKIIANQGCMINRSNSFKHFPGYERCNCNYDKCDQSCMSLTREYPWLDLSTSNLFKEELQFIDYDIIKLSTRSPDMCDGEIDGLLKYWTTDTPTDSVNLITNPNTGEYEMVEIGDHYDNFIRWLSHKYNCIGTCGQCKACEMIYNTLVHNEEYEDK